MVRQAPDLEVLRKDLQVWRPPLLLALYSYQFSSVYGDACELLRKSSEWQLWQQQPSSLLTLDLRAATPMPLAHRINTAVPALCPPWPLPPPQAVLAAGISSVAVVLKHAAIYPQHERLVGELARGMGFRQVRGLRVSSP